MTGAATLAIELPDDSATCALAAELAHRAQKGDVIGLSGPLGSGKTVFARAFIRTRFGAEEEVPSPTFALVEVYEARTGPSIWHFDLYRLERPEDAYELGLEEALSDGITLIEWPERLGALLPCETLGVDLAPGPGETERRVRLDVPPGWTSRIAGLERG